MSDDTPFANAVISRLDAIQGDVGELRGDIKGLATKVEATYARESDCVSRVAHEREQTGHSVKRIWETIDGHGERLEAIGGRVAVLEKSATIDDAQTVVKVALWKWVLGVIVSLAVGAAVGWMRGKTG